MSRKVEPHIADFGEAWPRLSGPPIAHRGLWTAEGAPENSLAAFQHAAEQGYGVELDVQITADGEKVLVSKGTPNPDGSPPKPQLIIAPANAPIKDGDSDSAP